MAKTKCLFQEKKSKMVETQIGSQRVLDLSCIQNIWMYETKYLNITSLIQDIADEDFKDF